MHEISTQLAPLADFNKIRRIEGFERISDEYPIYLTDESKLSPEPFDYLFFPMAEAELAAIFRQMSQKKTKVNYKDSHSRMHAKFIREISKRKKKHLGKQVFVQTRKEKKEK